MILTKNWNKYPKKKYILCISLCVFFSIFVSESEINILGSGNQKQRKKKFVVKLPKNVWFA